MIKAPFPYFGGKSRVAAEVWRRFGDTPNYVEPFFGSGAVLLARPTPPGIETINDADGLLVNFWRALRADPDAVAHYADWPVSEIDLHARHAWLRNARADVERMLADPGYYDVKAAGWWVWGISCWIGGGWGYVNYKQLPDLRHGGKGINRKQCPYLGSGGMGINASRAADLRGYFAALAKRLKRVRITCGDWARVTGPTPTIHNGLTAVFLDPPYSHGERDASIYAVESGTVAADARQWAIENGVNPLMRIALCGYDTEHGDAMPDSWEVLRWRTQGGYGNLSDKRGRENKVRETIWFSPHCLKVRGQLMLL